MNGILCYAGLVFICDIAESHNSYFSVLGIELHYLKLGVIRHFLFLFISPLLSFYLFIFYFFGQAKILSFNAWVTEDSVGLPAKRVNRPTSTAELSRCAASSPT